MKPVALLILLVLAITANAQNKVDPTLSYERTIVVVPMVGAGTYTDPRRPAFIAAEGASRRRDGIIAFSYQVSDDGTTALVEFVAVNRAALLPVLQDARAAGRTFVRGKDKKQDIERELKKYRKDFSLDNFLSAVAQ